MFYKSYYVLFLYIFISTMRAAVHITSMTNSTRGYGETERDRKRSSYTVPEVVAAIGFVIIIMKLSCRNE